MDTTKATPGGRRVFLLSNENEILDLKVGIISVNVRHKLLNLALN